jgi:hypothetical protein
MEELKAQILDLPQINVKIENVEVNNAVKGDYMFYYNTDVTEVPTLDFSGLDASSRLTQTFYMNKNLRIVEKFIFPENTTASSAYNQMLMGCESLVDFEAGGTIVQTISFAECPLSVKSMKSIISCLKDFTGASNDFDYTVTFKTSAFNELEKEGATAEYNGAACTWAELIDNKKWNLVKA